ncbi:MAG: GTPase Era [Coriobacteriia bacterium]|nr:GTPase Era [Coriobacteriia bacterium]
MSPGGSSAPSNVRSGFVALLGRPNAGKSTLVNAAAGTKVAIVSSRPQTTRQRLRAVIDREDAQIVLVDTPGLHKPQDALGAELNRAALMALSDVDVACLVLDASQPVGKGDAWVARHLAESRAPRKVLVVTKADLTDQETVRTQIERAEALMDFDHTVVVSALTGFNVDGFIDTVADGLPFGPRYFPRDMATDQQIETMIAEFIREKVLRVTFDEIPHAVGVVLDELRYDEERDMTTIEAVVYVERDSQKGILIGKGGDVIKHVGTEARMDLERLLGTKVYLGLMVKVKANWRRDAAQVKRFGYGEGV